MMLAALRPELFGPIIVAGSPLSYWAGVRGQYPMRYSGGLLGGSWLTALTSDLGAGKFDGAWLVQNFENQNPANTLWTKQYNLYSKVDTEASRYLGFERWWGGHVNLNAEEIQFIVDELFVGNKLAVGQIKTADNTEIDLRNIRSPIVVFCSKGDNVTPPQQALGWILDLYDHESDIRLHGQTIVYTIHETVGHLGIFVSGQVVRKEHGEFSSNIDLIDTLPPGLYEAVLEEKADATANPDLAGGNWVMRCEARTLDDIRSLGGNDEADERRFATAARVSEINLALYRSLAQPFVRALTSAPLAKWLQQCHPLRLQYEFFSDANPMMAAVARHAARVREHRKPAKADNPFIAMQEQISRQIVAALDGWQQLNESFAEKAFLSLYGSPTLQAAVGIPAGGSGPLRRATKSLLHKELLQRRISEIKSQVSVGGVREAVIRSMLYAGLDRRSIDERGFETARRIREAHGEMSLSDLKKLLREQFYILLIDEKAAVDAIPTMLPADRETRIKAYDIVQQVLRARGEFSAEGQRRLKEVARLFGLDEEGSKALANRRSKRQLAIVRPS